jgi:hypothetical protein
VVGTEKMQRDVWLIADDPAVVGVRRYMEELTDAQRKITPVLEPDSGSAGDYEPDVLNVTTAFAEGGAHML